MDCDKLIKIAENMKYNFLFHSKENNIFVIREKNDIAEVVFGNILKGVK